MEHACMHMQMLILVGPSDLRLESGMAESLVDGRMGCEGTSNLIVCSQSAHLIETQLTRYTLMVANAHMHIMQLYWGYY